MNQVNDISETYYTYTDVTSGEWYIFKVRALSSIDGQSDFSDYLDIQAATTPSNPTGLWSSNKSSHIEHYLCFSVTNIEAPIAIDI